MVFLRLKQGHFESNRLRRFGSESGLTRLYVVDWGWFTHDTSIHGDPAFVDLLNMTQILDPTNKTCYDTYVTAVNNH